jgi:hypothetical protein
MSVIMTARRGLGALLTRGGAAALVVAAGFTLTVSAAPPAANVTPPPAALTSLACRSATHCVAVGDSNADRPADLFAENWNGTAWTRIAVAKPAGTVSARLNGVACPDNHPCIAVGKAQPASGTSYAIAALWNGKSWSVAKAAAPGSGSQLTGVSCPSVSSCYAVGSYLPKGSGRTVLAEHWNGRAWAQQPAAAPHGSSDAILYAVSCATASMCVAAGDDKSGSLVERWNGTAWAATRPPTTSTQLLWDVSCPTAASCFAVGGDTDEQGSLIDHWNGKTWTQDYPVTAVDFGDPRDQSVSCSSASFCLAVGNLANSVALGRSQFVERWNGKQWAGDNVPFTGGTPGYFVQVRCLSATSCVALSPGSAEFWNGSSWRTVPTQ